MQRGGIKRSKTDQGRISKKTKVCIYCTYWKYIYIYRPSLSDHPIVSPPHQSIRSALYDLLLKHWWYTYWIWNIGFFGSTLDLVRFSDPQLVYLHRWTNLFSFWQFLDLYDLMNASARISGYESNVATSNVKLTFCSCTAIFRSTDCVIIVSSVYCMVFSFCLNNCIREARIRQVSFSDIISEICGNMTIYANS